MKLVIGKPTKKEVPRNVYQFHLSLMHGDDEMCMEDLTNFGEDDPNLLIAVEILQRYMETDFSAREDPYMFVEQLFEDQKENEVLIDEYTDILRCLVGYDYFFDGILAGLDKFEITYYDEDGAEFEVKIKED